MANYSADDFTNGVNTALIEDRGTEKEKGLSRQREEGKMTEYGKVEHRLVMRKNRILFSSTQD